MSNWLTITLKINIVEMRMHIDCAEMNMNSSIIYKRAHVSEKNVSRIVFMLAEPLFVGQWFRWYVMMPTIDMPNEYEEHNNFLWF